MAAGNRHSCLPPYPKKRTCTPRFQAIGAQEYRCSVCRCLIPGAAVILCIAKALQTATTRGVTCPGLIKAVICTLSHTPALRPTPVRCFPCNRLVRAPKTTQYLPVLFACLPFNIRPMFLRVWGAPTAAQSRGTWPGSTLRWRARLSRRRGRARSRRGPSL